MACSRIPPLRPPSSCKRLRDRGFTAATRLSRITCKRCGRKRKPGVPSCAWSPPPASVLRSTGDTSARWSITATRENCTPSVLVECHSRKMYLEFTHSQTFETLVRCHIHAFEAMGGVARELWFDNMATVVAEHDGNLVRFHPRFLAFAREYDFIPRACHVAAAWEKGKVERAIGYVRQNFWPLRQFTDLADVNSQAHQWLKQVANQRRHRETGQTPDERFRPECLRPLPGIASGLPRQRRSGRAQGSAPIVRRQSPDGQSAEDERPGTETEILIGLLPFQPDLFNALNLPVHLFRNPNRALKLVGQTVKRFEGRIGARRTERGPLGHVAILTTPNEVFRRHLEEYFEG